MEDIGRTWKGTDVPYNFTLNISFINKSLIDNRVNNIVHYCHTLEEANEWYDVLVDDTVDRALVKNNVSGEVTWLKKDNDEERIL